MPRITTGRSGAGRSERAWLRMPIRRSNGAKRKTFAGKCRCLTNAHSKKWENHEAMLALYYCWYNWCRSHSTLKSTPAVAAGLATETWTLEKLLTEAAKVERKFVTLS